MVVEEGLVVVLVAGLVAAAGYNPLSMASFQEYHCFCCSYFYLFSLGAGTGAAGGGALAGGAGGT